MTEATVDSSIGQRHKIIFIMFNLVLWVGGVDACPFAIWLNPFLLRPLDWFSYGSVCGWRWNSLGTFDPSTKWCPTSSSAPDPYSSSSTVWPAFVPSRANRPHRFCIRWVRQQWWPGELELDRPLSPNFNRFQYGLVLGVLFVAELLLSVSMLWLKQRLQMNFNEHVNMQEGPIDMDLIQSSLNCCGLRGFGDWVQLVNATSSSSAGHLSIPSSCCSSPYCDTRNSDNLWPQGCVSQMETFIDNNVGVMSLLVLSFAAVTLLGVFCSFSFARKVSVSSYEVIGDWGN